MDVGVVFFYFAGSVVIEERFIEDNPDLLCEKLESHDERHSINS